MIWTKENQSYVYDPIIIHPVVQFYVNIDDLCGSVVDVPFCHATGPGFDPRPEREIWGDELCFLYWVSDVCMCVKYVFVRHLCGISVKLGPITRALLAWSWGYIALCGFVQEYVQGYYNAKTESSSSVYLDGNKPKPRTL